MIMAPRIGVIDSGGPAEDLPGGRAFLPDGTSVAPVPDRLGHGTAVAQVLRRAWPSVQLVHAQVFLDRPVTSSAQVAAAVSWLGDPRRSGGQADIICLSLGLAVDRAPLRRACIAALEQGVLLVAASPARGEPCFPAAYPGVIAATGDARCDWDQVSVLPGGVFGAWCGSPERGHSGQGGASMATARVAGLLAVMLASGHIGPASAWLRARASFHGVERRVAQE
ncbi:subtilisin-like serine protease QhpE [Gemmobacter fulva]|nr:S8/S53 family peptidase [Gemmobacter fulvus]